MDTSTQKVSAPRNDQNEFDRLIAGTRSKAYKLAYRMTGDRDDAKDLVQDAYLRAYCAFGKYNRDLPFENWFCRILRNLFIDRHRLKRPKPLSLYWMMTSGGYDEERLLDLPDDHANPERLLLDQVLEERLQEALNALPETYYTAILLCAVEQRTYEEIAGIMCCSVGTVRSRIHRGRVRLRTKLAMVPTVDDAQGRQC